MAAVTRKKPCLVPPLSPLPIPEPVECFTPSTRQCVSPRTATMNQKFSGFLRATAKVDPNEHRLLLALRETYDPVAEANRRHIFQQLDEGFVSILGDVYRTGGPTRPVPAEAPIPKPPRAQRQVAPAEGASNSATRSPRHHGRQKEEKRPFTTETGKSVSPEAQFSPEDSKESPNQYSPTIPRSPDTRPSHRARAADRLHQRNRRGRSNERRRKQLYSGYLAEKHQLRDQATAHVNETT